MEFIGRKKLKILAHPCCFVFNYCITLFHGKLQLKKLVPEYLFYLYFVLIKAHFQVNPSSDTMYLPALSCVFLQLLD